MRAYDKNEVDAIFSSWQGDLDQLSVIDIILVSVIEDIKAEIEEKRTNILYCVQDFTPNDVLDIIDDISEIIDKHTKGDINADSD